ncbi:MAG TPA: glycosyltransferase family 2 protein, partial [Flavobacteriales bacterium]|nr:glycosyltransferase family 2 protein [Flavobacteriales bacterium]
MTSNQTPDGAPLLSVVVITLNEAHNLPRLLKAVSGWADEILVFDSGSTDGTVEIAQAGGARVVDCAWEGWSKT